MTEEDIQKMTIEEIIYLPNFHSLENYTNGGYNEYWSANTWWRITFNAEPIGNEFISFGRKHPHRHYSIFKHRINSE